MKNLNDQLRQLFNKPEWTNEEKQWLLKYLEDAHTTDLKALMQAQFENEQKTDRENQEYSEEHVLALIHERIGLQNKPGRGRNGKVKFLRSLAAASAVGLLVLTGSIFFHDASKVVAIRKVPKEAGKNDVQPGGNKAILTLADGSTIVLTDKQNGELAAQGNTKVLKLGGRLTYQPSGSEPGKVLYNTIATPRGGQYQVVLADGSAVWLNSASSLRFPTDFVGKERSVEMSGEAYFEVAKNGAMPFVVALNGAAVQVLGTHFNVKAYKNEAVLKTTLLEGAVKFVAGNQTATLQPGQQSQLGETGNVNVVNGVDVDRVVAWKNGYFDFEGEDLAAVAKQLSRWYDVEVTGTDKITEKFYAEIPRNTTLQDALRALELTGKVRFLLEGKKVTVKP